MYYTKFFGTGHLHLSLSIIGASIILYKLYLYSGVASFPCDFDCDLSPAPGTPHHLCLVSGSHYHTHIYAVHLYNTIIVHAHACMDIVLIISCVVFSIYSKNMHAVARGELKISGKFPSFQLVSACL